MNRSLKCVTGSLTLAAVLMMTAQPALATIKCGKSNNQQLAGCDEFGNWNYEYGINNGRSKVFKYVTNGIPGLVFMAAKGIVTNMSRKTQRFRNIPIWIQDPDIFWLRYPAQCSSTCVLTFWRKSHGLNISTATFRLDQAVSDLD